jgi:hypothetical protein
MLVTTDDVDLSVFNIDLWSLQYDHGEFLECIAAFWLNIWLISILFSLLVAIKANNNFYLLKLFCSFYIACKIIYCLSLGDYADFYVADLFSLRWDREFVFMVTLREENLLWLVCLLVFVITCGVYSVSN